MDIKNLDKTKIPQLDSIEFELGPFEEDEPITIHTLIKKLLDKTNSYTKFLEDILHPDSSLVAMQEASFFENIEREEMYAVFKELTFYERKELLVYLQPTEDNLISYFNEFFSVWIEKKQTIEVFVTKAIASWNDFKTIQKDETQRYFG